MQLAFVLALIAILYLVGSGPLLALATRDCFPEFVDYALVRIYSPILEAVSRGDSWAKPFEWYLVKCGFFFA